MFYSEIKILTEVFTNKKGEFELLDNVFMG
jgi:hypothetical protein